MRGQQIHGIRYFIAAFLFSTTWNLLATATVPKRRPAYLYAFVCVLVVCWMAEFPIALRIDRGRSANLIAMEHAQLDRLSVGGLAGDVGFIGYFSRAPICDMNGLVNGRAAAQLPAAQRIEECLAARPSFAFLTSIQMWVLDHDYDFNSQADWLNCGSVDFTNVDSDDRHWLLVRRSMYPQGCPANL